MAYSNSPATIRNTQKVLRGHFGNSYFETAFNNFEIPFKVHFRITRLMKGKEKIGNS